MAYLVFIGPMASGKTKIGKRLAGLTKKTFRDTDKVIVAEHGEIAKIFQTQGEAEFRKLEAEAVKKTLEEFPDGIISLGGGAVLAQSTQQLLKEQPVVLLTVSATQAAIRLAIGSKRPLITNGVNSWKTITEARMPLYNTLAKATFDTSSGRFDKLAGEILSWREKFDSESGQQ